MDRKAVINKIFKTLYIYEDSVEKYSKYIGKLLIVLSGLEDDEIDKEAITMIKELKALGTEVDHDMVKSTVFKVINMVKLK